MDVQGRYGIHSGAFGRVLGEKKAGQKKDFARKPYNRNRF